MTYSAKNKSIESEVMADEAAIQGDLNKFLAQTQHPSCYVCGNGVNIPRSLSEPSSQIKLALPKYPALIFPSKQPFHQTLVLFLGKGGLTVAIYYR